jgi:hypothetical protein
VQDSCSKERVSRKKQGRSSKQRNTCEQYHDQCVPNLPFHLSLHRRLDVHMDLQALPSKRGKSSNPETEADRKRRLFCFALNDLRLDLVDLNLFVAEFRKEQSTDYYLQLRCLYKIFLRGILRVRHNAMRILTDSLHCFAFRGGGRGQLAGFSQRLLHNSLCDNDLKTVQIGLLFIGRFLPGFWLC